MHSFFLAIGWAYMAVPPIRSVLQRLLGFRVEVIIEPRYEDMGDPYGIYVKPDGVSGWISALLNLNLINHSRSNPERITECWVELRKRHLLFWHRTIASMPVLTSSSDDWRLNYPIKDIYLEPIGKPQTMTIDIGGDFTCDKMPKRSELVLVFKMVGLIREYRKKLTKIRHNPERSKENLKHEHIA